ncbi:MAG TPA: 2-oxoglutarate dehydrogenase E1 component [Aggregatilineaceae bacterium]|nr:2-oxoglutarate dehydrogenase E1 component [Aggregatilineaceae bacterium]
MDFWRDFHGPNAGYILELYERYKQNPATVDEAARQFFAQWTPPAATNGASTPAADISEIVGAVNLARAIREYGHLDAQLDPLGSEPPGDPALEFDTYGLNENTLRRLPASLVGGPISQQADNALVGIQKLRDVYSSTIAYDFEHVHIPKKRQWLREAAESGRFRLMLDAEKVMGLFRRLTEVEAFEQFIHRVFPGKHRFSIEGLDMMVPMLDEMICAAGENAMSSVLIGMAHRGRLNVLTHILQKPYAQILAEFKDPIKGLHFRDDLGWTGDVKYHKGAYRAREGNEPCLISVIMAPNPSHLEAVNPVIEGMARATGTLVNHRGAPDFDPMVTLPILIHGDAAFPGQGIVAETLNMSRLPGYWTGGTIHIISNNQLGYTTLPEDSRSTLYASDLAKGFQIPIVHVNADAPEACMEAARMAFAYRAEFQRDFVIDLIGYRRYGHNEGDEPAFTQPRMYEVIREHPTVRALWAQTLVKQGQITEADASAVLNEQMTALQQALESLKPDEMMEPQPEPAPPGTARRVKTRVEIKRLQQLNDALLTLPDGFQLHAKLDRARKRRREALQDVDAKAVDWATAEELALASILEDGTAIRMTGEDTERGTFNQRHAVLHDEETGEIFVPLQSMPQAKGAFEIHNSPLTEAATIGFEYGYNIQAPQRLVLWEGQYGDFINSAQVILDEFLLTGRAKWGQMPSLVLLLPHGYEGAGPDHSSGRLERFLQMAGEQNIRVVNCTTAAQYFHLLRRQAALLTIDPLPLIVMTPKSLLRHPMVASSLRELAEGQWQFVINDEEAWKRADQIKRVFVCSGKIFVDLMNSPLRQQHPEVAIVRIEQLYPFRTDDLGSILEGYPQLEEVVWVQEEPENMGAWTFMYPQLLQFLDGRWPLRYVGRAVSSSPAEGSAAWHGENQATLIQQAYDRRPDPKTDDFIIS